jgi:hypothetical protein
MGAKNLGINLKCEGIKSKAISYVTLTVTDEFWKELLLGKG